MSDGNWDCRDEEWRERREMSRKDFNRVIGLEERCEKQKLTTENKAYCVFKTPSYDAPSGRYYLKLFSELEEIDFRYARFLGVYISKKGISHQDTNIGYNTEENFDELEPIVKKYELKLCKLH